MKRLILAAIAFAVLGLGGALISGGLPQKDSPKLRLTAVLAESQEDVTDRVEWFLERDGAWLGPNIETASEAVAGQYDATFEILGGAPVTAELTLAEGEGGDLRTTLDASLVEVAIDPEDRTQRFAFRYGSDLSVGSADVPVSDDGFARALVSRGLTDLELELAGRSIPINANFASGTILKLKLESGVVVPFD